ncbi:MAG: cyclase [Phycisphaerales bacterium]|jgi:cyclase
MPIHATRRSFLASTLATTAGLALGPIALARAWKRGSDGLILPWDELSPGVHAMIDQATGGNVAVVGSQGEALVIDTKFPYLGEAIRTDAGTLGGESITLINTHHHGDHTGGNSAFRSGDNAVTGLAHTNAVERIEGQVQNYKSAAAGGPRQANDFAPDNERLNEMARAMATRADALTATDWTPSLGLGNSGTITVGETEIAYAHHGPGHTDNDLVLSIDGGRVIHTGDLVFNGLHPFFDPAGGVTARGWIGSLTHVLKACDAETVVIPGHGPKGGRETVSAQIAYLERLIDAVQAELDAGTSKADAQEKSWGFMDGLGFASIRGRAIGAVYDELAG